MNPLKYAEQICYSSRETLHFTYRMSERYKNGTGSYVETGVAAGAQIIAMALAAPNKKIYAFDSFEGIPLPSNRDDQMPGIRMLSPEEQAFLPNPGNQELTTSGATSVSKADFWINVNSALNKEQSKNILAIEGWFENTLPKYKSIVGPIDILRLDCDLYNSTLVALENLFPLVQRGHLVIIDDWTLKGCMDACKDYFGTIRYKPNYEFLSTTAYFYK